MMPVDGPGTRLRKTPTWRVKGQDPKLFFKKTVFLSLLYNLMNTSFLILDVDVVGIMFVELSCRKKDNEHSSYVHNCS